MVVVICSRAEMREGSGMMGVGYFSGVFLKNKKFNLVRERVENWREDNRNRVVDLSIYHFGWFLESFSLRIIYFLLVVQMEDLSLISSYVRGSIRFRSRG